MPKAALASYKADPYYRYCSNQRDEVIETGNITGALMAVQNMQMQTFVASFSAGAGKKAGGISYSESIAPTLKASPSGNVAPSVLCLSDQGGQVMDWSENVTATLRSQEHGHQPAVLFRQPQPGLPL